MSDDHGPRVDPKALDLGYEPQDVAGRHIALALSGVLAMLLLVCGAVAGLFHLFGQPLSHAPRPVDARLSPPEPRLQIDERADRAVIEKRAANGRAIDQAMRLTAREGWPGRSAGAK